MKRILIFAFAAFLLKSCVGYNTITFEQPQPHEKGETLNTFPQELRGVWNKTNNKDFDSLMNYANQMRSKIEFTQNGDLKENKNVKIDKSGKIIFFENDGKESELIGFENKQKLDYFLKIFDKNKNLITVDEKSINLSWLFNTFFLQHFMNVNENMNYKLNEDIILKKWNDNYFINRKAFPNLEDSCLSLEERKKAHWETYILKKNTNGNWDMFALNNPWDEKSESLLMYRDQKRISNFNLNQGDLYRILKNDLNRILTFKGDSILNGNEPIVNDFYENSDELKTKETAEISEYQLLLNKAKKYDQYDNFIEFIIGTNTGFSIIAENGCADCETNLHDPSTLETFWKGELSSDSLPIGTWRKTTNNGKEISLVTFNKVGQLEGNFIIRNLWDELIVKGSFVNEGKNGNWIYNNPYNGKRIEGQYSNNQKTGQWNWFLNDKKYRTASFLNDQLEGDYISYSQWIDGVALINEQGVFKGGKAQSWNTNKQKQETQNLEFEARDFEDEVSFSEEINYLSIAKIKLKGQKAQLLTQKGKIIGEGNFILIDSTIVDVNKLKNSTVEISLKNKELNNIISKTGIWNFYYSSGNIKYSGEFCCENTHCGTWKKYYPNGKIAFEIGVERGEYTLLKNGICKYYDDKGNLKTESIFKARAMTNSEIKRMAYHENGKIKEKFQGNIWGADGLQEEFYDNGQIKRKFNAIDGQIIGDYSEFYKNGKLKTNGNFIIHGGKGVLDGDFLEYHENGQLKSKIKFRKGVPIGSLEVFYDNGNPSIKGSFSEIENHYRPTKIKKCFVSALTV
ncbi:MAG: hypothetical protein FGM14_08195 [Flavobacteriales bacterium]|nr:hypothetical protein [Flavobacteriales bacterium]